MEQAQVVFAKHFSNERNGKYGPFWSHDFVTVDDFRVSTIKQDMANAAYALGFTTAPDGTVTPTGLPVQITYSTTQNTSSDGRIFTNHKLESVQAIGEAGAMAPGVLPTQVGTSSGAPTSTSANNASTSTYAIVSTAPTTSSNKDDAAPRIARAVAFEHLPEYMAAGIVSMPDSVDELFDLLGSCAKWIFNGSRPAPAVTGAHSSGAVGGGDAGAATSQAAPAPSSEPVAEVEQAESTDDIPF